MSAGSRHGVLDCKACRFWYAEFFSAYGGRRIAIRPTCLVLLRWVCCCAMGWFCFVTNPPLTPPWEGNTLRCRLATILRDAGGTLALQVLLWTYPAGVVMFRLGGFARTGSPCHCFWPVVFFLVFWPVVLSWWTILDECLGRLANALVGCIPLRPQNPLWSYSTSVPNIHNTIFLTSLSYPRQNHLWSLPYGAWLFMIWCEKQILRVNNFMESLTLLAQVQSAYFLFFWSCTTS